jgi:serine/threonine protein kinase/tetratricopeptide (TPR) repeat protein
MDEDWSPLLDPAASPAEVIARAEAARARAGSAPPPDAALALGRALLSAGRPDDAVSVLAPLAEGRDRTALGASQALARCARAQFDPGAQLQHLRRAAELAAAIGDPEAETALHLQLALTHANLGDGDAALAALGRAPLVRPDPVRASVWHRVGRHEQAEAECRAVSEDPQTPPAKRRMALLVRGQAAIRAGDAALAIEIGDELVAAATSDAELAEALLVRGDGHRHARHLAVAQLAFTRVTTLLPPDHRLVAYAQLDLGLVALEEGRFADAEAWFVGLDGRFAEHPLARAALSAARLACAAANQRWQAVDALARATLGVIGQVHLLEPDFADTLGLAASTCEAQGTVDATDRAVLLHALAYDAWASLRQPERGARHLAALQRLGQARQVAPLGPYLLRDTLGQGSQGGVWRAVHLWTGAPVAVKILPLARSRDARAMVDRELASMAALDHPNVARILDTGRVGPATAAALGVAEGSPWMAMELATLGTLSSRCGRLPWPECRRLLLELLDGLAHAHARGILHLDLKPQNVLLTNTPEAPTPLLADFGLARRLQQTTPSRQLAGTPLYMAPEQLRRQAWRCGPWTDLYAFGCLLVELLTGKPPFPYHTLAEVTRGHLTEDPPPLVTPLPVPPGVAVVVARLLAKEPAERYLFAADVAADLEALDGAPPAAEIRPDWRRPPRAVRVESDTHGIRSWRAPQFVGRETERDALWAALVGAVTARTTSYAVIEGPVGVGASRLARWLGEAAQEWGAAAVLRVTHVPGGDAATAWREGLTDALFLRGVPPESLPQQLARLGLPPDALAALAADLGSSRRVLDAAARIVRAWSRERPVVVVIDEVNFGPESVALATSFARQLVPVLFVLVHRTDAAHRSPAVADALGALLRWPRVTHVVAPPMPASDLRDVMDRILPLAPDLSRALVDRAGGLPAHVVTWIDQLMDRQRLVAGPAGYRLRPGEERLPRGVPPVPTGWLERVFDGLSEGAVEATWVASLLAPRVDGWAWATACAALGLPPDPAALDRLAAEGALRPSNGGWVFVSAPAVDALRRAADRSPRFPDLAAAAARVQEKRNPGRAGRLWWAVGEPGRAGPLLLAGARAAIAADRRATALELAGFAEEALRRAGIPHSDPRWAEPRTIGIRARWGTARWEPGVARAAFEHAVASGWSTAAEELRPYVAETAEPPHPAGEPRPA